MQDQLHDVVDVFSTHSAFCALKRDGSVVTWGAWYAGGDSALVSNIPNTAEAIDRFLGGGLCFEQVGANLQNTQLAATMKSVVSGTAEDLREPATVLPPYESRTLKYKGFQGPNRNPLPVWRVL